MRRFAVMFALLLSQFRVEKSTNILGLGLTVKI